jgi:methionyl-tRNA formyltransferase
VDAGHEVAGVVAQPDRPVGRGHAVSSPPTVILARELAIPVYQPEKIKTGAFPEWLEGARADLGVVVAYGRILTPRHLAAPRLGCINVHASLLPRWRGAAPVQAAILAGDERTGITTMRMAEGLDTGDMLLREETVIGSEETAPELADRLAAMGARLAVETVERRPDPVPQDHAAATWAPMLTREMAPLDWTRSAAELHRRVRALTPWPGTTTTFRGEVLKILRATVADGQGPPGSFLPGGRVACGEAALRLVEVQQAGRRAVAGEAFCNGARLMPGDRLV